MLSDKQKSVIAKVAIGSILAYFTYRVLIKKDNLKQAVENTAIKPLEIVSETIKVGNDVAEKTIDTVVDTSKKLARFVKGSPEAKEHMRKLRESPNFKHKKKKETISKKKD